MKAYESLDNLTRLKKVIPTEAEESLYLFTYANMQKNFSAEFMLSKIEVVENDNILKRLKLNVY